jgi:exonuclease SbcC
MRITYLELKNYRRFRQLKLQFPDGIVGILGMNGTGKTTIIEAIAWTLFGNVDEVVRTSREGVRRVGASPSESCLAVLEFELGGVEYRIEREMSGRSLHMRATLRTKDKLLADGDRPVKTMVEKLLGMDNKSFFTSVFARQKELNALQNVAPGERKKVILRMLRIDSIDSVLTSIRSDKNSVHSKIEGSERTLLTEDGREKEKVLGERIPEIRRAFDQTSKDLTKAQAEERAIAKSAEDTRKLRDELRKDVDAFNSTLGDLRAKLSAVEELGRHRDTVAARIDRDRPKLSRLPSLSKDEEDWKLVSVRKEEIQNEKALSDKAKLLAEGIAEDERDLERRNNELSELRKGLDVGDIELKFQEIEQGRTLCDQERQKLLTDMGRLKGAVHRSAESIEKESKKLADIQTAGQEGTCPTCEQRLEGAYDKLVQRLKDDLEKTRKEGIEAQRGIGELEREISGLANKEEALKKKRARLDQDKTRIEKARATIAARESEQENMGARLARKRKDLQSLGEIKFDAREHKRVLEEFERLKRAHDEYMNLKNVEVQIQHLERDRTEATEKIVKATAEAEKYRGLLNVLEPKKNAYDSVLIDLDSKNASHVEAKDRVGNLSSARERAHAELERAENERAEIERVKKAIEQDRKQEEDLAVLEEVIVNFRVDLISRIAPTLATLTSKGLESMTDGRYSRVELEEDYEMKIDDQGTLYPVGRFSGGESDLANLCLRLAISAIIADRTGANPINILILDEIFGSLDPSRKRSVMAALTRLSGQFRQVFLITHIEDVKDLMNHVVRVQELEDGSSSAELVS